MGISRTQTMCSDKTIYIESQYYIGPERRHAHNPRREQDHDRRHRTRNESLISDCRTNNFRRQEDGEGFFEFSTLYENIITKEKIKQKKKNK
jgi:hypothetical protein